VPDSNERELLDMTLTNQLRIGVRSIGYGVRLRDKIAIGLLLGLYLLHPIGSLARRIGVRLPDPARMIKQYRCRSSFGIFICPGGGPYFLACDPSYDPGVALMIDQLSEGTFLDIGANVGFFTVRAAKRLGQQGRVLALEPHPTRFDLLKGNIALNELVNVTALPYAAGSANGRATIFEPDHSFGPHPLDISCAAPGDKAIEVDMRTIDTILDTIGAPPLSLVKMDVEGFEPQVIGGMLRTLERTGVPVIFEALDSEALSQSKSSLSKLGYSVTRLDHINFLAKRSTTDPNGPT
jgi:FkbM family methyltransferase